LRNKNEEQEKMICVFWDDFSLNVKTFKNSYEGICITVSVFRIPRPWKANV